MSAILEVGEDGLIQVPAGDLLQAAPHSKFAVSVLGNQLLLAPVERVEQKSEPFWKTATREEWAANFQAWVDSHKDGPGLPDSAVGRDSIYD